MVVSRFKCHGANEFDHLSRMQTLYQPFGASPVLGCENLLAYGSHAAASIANRIGQVSQNESDVKLFHFECLYSHNQTNTCKKGWRCAPGGSMNHYSTRSCKSAKAVAAQIGLPPQRQGVLAYRVRPKYDVAWILRCLSIRNRWEAPVVQS
jgi:hypothetical protein